jgi:hypothetical protein
MKTQIKKIGTLFLVSIVFVSCSPSDPTPAPMPPATCNTVGTPLQLLATSLMSSTSTVYTDDVWMDLDTHEYTFTLTTNKTICSLGYQNQGGYTGQYLMEIRQGSTVLYSGNHSFVSTSTVFVPITPVALTAGIQYKISRTLLSGTNMSHQLGRGIRVASGSVPFPVNNGNMTVISSNFYGSGGPVPNAVIPFIDFGTY